MDWNELIQVFKSKQSKTDALRDCIQKTKEIDRFNSKILLFIIKQIKENNVNLSCKILTLVTSETFNQKSSEILRYPGKKLLIL
jgi:hypothetical protein